ncbi:MAG: vancomycin high temperature exclusion protein [Spirochaetia bacterium]
MAAASGVLRILFIILRILILLGLAFVIYCNWNIHRTSKGYLYSSVRDIPDVRTILLLGTSRFRKGGGQNPYFTYRIDAAAELYRRGKARYILASGDNSKTWYNEPQEMKNELIRRGVPAEAIYMDFAGLRTLDSVVRSKEVFGIEESIIVTQEFHGKRAVYIARQYGIDAVGFNAGDVPFSYGFKTRFRELFARVKAYIDIHITGTEPKFLGERVEILDSPLPETGE